MPKFLLFSLCTLSLCTFGQVLQNQNYVGMYKKSIREYEFYSNETFWYRSQGQTGQKECTGRFQQIGDTLVLNAVSTDSLAWPFEQLKNKKLLVLPDTCLLDLESGYDYCLKYFKLNGKDLQILPSRRRAKANKAFRSTD